MKIQPLFTCTDYLYSFTSRRIIKIITTKVKEVTMETRLNIVLLQKWGGGFNREVELFVFLLEKERS